MKDWHTSELDDLDAAPRATRRTLKRSTTLANGFDTAGVSPLPLEWFADIEAKLVGLWLIKKLLPAIGMALIYGHPGASKSFFALELAFHIAAGREWHGRAVRRGLVIYVGAEGSGGLRNRISALRVHYGMTRDDKIPLALLATSLDLQDPHADTPQLIATIRAAAATSGAAPVLIVVDTLAATFGAGSENTDDMASYVANCQLIASNFECCVMPVHHRPKDSTNDTPRGHGSLAGGLDTILLIEAGEPNRVRVTKQKDGERIADMAFNLVPVALGLDEDGELVTSCIVAMVDSVPPRAAGPAKLNNGQAVTLAALHRAIAAKGQHAPPNIPLSILKAGLVSHVVTMSEWADETRATLIGPDIKPDSERRAFERNAKSLQSRGIIQVWEGFAWPTPH